MNSISSIDSELIGLLRAELGFSTNASIRQESAIRDKYPIQFDLVIEDGNRMYAVELKRIVRFESLSKIGFLKLLLSASNLDTQNIEFVIAGKRITSEALEASKEIGIRFIKLPASIGLEEAHVKPVATSMKLASPKSWQVISSLLKIKDASIRQLSIKSGVSYGWTHAIIKALASKGIISDTGGRINITDINKLLNGIAWERPFERLFAQEIRMAANSPIGLAQEICSVCSDQQIQFAFTSFTAGEIYTGYSARHDTAYLYLEKKNIAKLAGMFDVTAAGGIAVRIYTPDRDVFKDRRMLSAEGIWLVSPAQLLLDCAGLGYSGRDITLKLVEIYDQL
jgi:hypothetical protein